MHNQKLLFSDKIFVAGASGMAGSAICRALRKLKYGDQRNGGQILTPSRNELNLLNSKDVREWLVKDGETINDDTFKSACRIASKLIYIAEAPFKGKDRPETQRRRAKKV